MSKDNFMSMSPDVEEKAGYNQAGKISDILSMLRYTFIGSMLDNPNNFHEALECCRGVLNIVAGKVRDDTINDLNVKIYKLDKDLVEANKTFIHNGIRYFKFPSKRTELKKEIENLWRKIEKIQDEYGYGMFSEDDSGL